MRTVIRLILLFVTATAITGCRGTHRCEEGSRFDETGECVPVETCPSGRDPVTGACANDAGEVDAGRVDAGLLDGGADGADGGPAQCTRPLDCDDGNFCNGEERCEPGAATADAMGCLPAEDMRCLASQTCDESMRRCLTMCDVSPDADGDGVDSVDCGGTDCDDSDDRRFPGNPEVCDALDHDEDCDTSTFGARDGDGDTYNDAQCCNVDADGSTLICGDDCDDSSGAIHPGATETCNLVDDDCDTDVDDGAGATCVLPDTATSVCTSGVCTPMTCDPGRGACDADPANGCETDTSSDDLHCGMCGNPCGECETCSGGSCVPAADGGACDGGAGQCRAGACCTGCWDGSTCQPGSTPTSCGGGGALCDTCPCTSDSCVSGACAPVGGGVVDFDVSEFHACGILSNRRLYCWGANAQGQLGLGDLVDRSAPAQVLSGTEWLDVDTGGQFSCGINSAANLFCWGLNASNELGVGDTTRRLVPTPSATTIRPSSVATGVAGCALNSGEIACWGPDLGTSPTRIGGPPPPYMGIDMSDEQNILQAIRSPGTFWRSDYGAALAQVGSASNWTVVNAAMYGGCLLNSDGQLWCWGEIGSGVVNTGVDPIRVGTATDWERISVTQSRLCGIRSGGQLWCAQGSGSPPAIVHVGSASWTDVAVQEFGTFALRGDGTLWRFAGDPTIASPSRVCFD